MATVSIPWGTIGKPVPKSPSGPTVKASSPDGRFKLLMEGGLWSIQQDGQIILSKVDEACARNRFSCLQRAETVGSPPLPPVSLSVEAVEPETKHKCPGCGCEVSDERIKLLRTEFCTNCIPKGNRPLGVMEYSGKQAGVLVITTSRKEFQLLKKAANQRR